MNTFKHCGRMTLFPSSFFFNSKVVCMIKSYELWMQWESEHHANLESRIVQQCQQTVNSLSYFCHFQQCCDDVSGLCSRPCFVEIMQDSDNNIVTQISVEYVLNSFNDYIPLGSTWLILTNFESSSCHGFTLYTVILQCWNERIPFGRSGCQPILFPALWPAPSNVTEATWQIRSH